MEVETAQLSCPWHCRSTGTSEGLNADRSGKKIPQAAADQVTDHVLSGGLRLSASSVLCRTDVDDHRRWSRQWTVQALVSSSQRQRHYGEQGTTAVQVSHYGVLQSQLNYHD